MRYNELTACFLTITCETLSLNDLHLFPKLAIAYCTFNKKIYKHLYGVAMGLTSVAHITQCFSLPL